MHNSKKTKIIATVGPACQKPEILKSLITEGVDVFRINASHSTVESLTFWFNLIRSVSMEMRTMGPLTGADVRANRQPPMAASAAHRPTTSRMRV